LENTYLLWQHQETKENEKDGKILFQELFMLIRQKEETRATEKGLFN